jgi:solute carrier family 25 (mitochondrial phosphate transporter), member 23/24/25/41
MSSPGLQDASTSSNIQKATSDFIMHMTIGGLSGVLSRTATAPLELQKIQQQNNYMPNSTLRDVLRVEGIKGLWKGNYVNSIRIFPQSAINFACYQFVKSYLFNCSFLSPIKNNDILLNFLSGTIAGLISMTAIYPLENIRSRLSLQTNKNHYTGVIDVFRKTPTKQLYNGLRMSLLGFAPYNALNFMFYGFLKSHQNPYLQAYKATNPLLYQLLSGGLAGTLAVTCTYPTDLIRRRLQLQGFDKAVPNYSGIIDCIKKVYRNEGGISGLYRGLGACYIKIFPAIAIQFWAMEFLTGQFRTQKLV